MRKNSVLELCIVLFLSVGRYLYNSSRQKIPQPLISVVIPVYNSEQYLEQCINSILNQSLRNFRIIFVDDGSQDDSSQILEKYAKIDSRFHVIKHPNNRGILSARMAGLSHVIGDYFCFLDPDDYFLYSDSLETMVQLMKMYRTDIVQFSVYPFNWTDYTECKTMVNLLRVYEKRIYGNKNIIAASLENHLFAYNLWNKVYRTKLVKLSAEYINNEVVNRGEDLWISFLLSYYACSFIGVRTKPLYAYRVGRGISTKQIDINSYREILSAHNSVLNIIKHFLINKKCFDSYKSIYSSIYIDRIKYQITLLRQLDEKDYGTALHLLNRYYSEEEALV